MNVKAVMCLELQFQHLALIKVVQKATNKTNKSNETHESSQTTSGFRIPDQLSVAPSVEEQLWQLLLQVTN